MHSSLRALVTSVLSCSDAFKVLHYSKILENSTHPKRRNLHCAGPSFRSRPQHTDYDSRMGRVVWVGHHSCGHAMQHMRQRVSGACHDIAHRSHGSAWIVCLCNVSFLMMLPFNHFCSIHFTISYSCSGVLGYWPKGALSHDHFDLNVSIFTCCATTLQHGKLVGDQAWPPLRDPRYCIR